MLSKKWLYGTAVVTALSVMISACNTTSDKQSTQPPVPKLSAKESSLYIQVSEGNIKQVTKLLTSGVNPNKLSEERLTPLMKAVLLDDHEMVALLLSKGAKPDEKGNRDKTALMLAAEKGSVDSVNTLLLHKADVQAKDMEGKTALWYAAQNGNLQVVQKLVEAKADVQMADLNGETPLFAAIQGKHLAVTEYLISAKADVNKTNKFGDSPLVRAVSLDNLDITKTLIQNKANVNVKDNFQEPLLQIAIRQGNVDIVKELIRAGVDVNETGAPTEMRESEKVKVTKLTPLQNAVLKDRITIAELLLQAGARVNDQDTLGKSALIMAVENGKIEMTKTLLKYKPDLYLKNFSGETVLLVAKKRGYPEIEEILNKAASSS